MTQYSDLIDITKNGLHVSIKEDTISHYKRMVAFAKKQNLKEEPSDNTMRSAIGETWFSKNCPYCKEYYRQGCGICPLSTPGSSCCNGIWTKLNYAKTWGEWIKYAKKVIKYIKDNG